ncbi:peptide chain release factor N(5)-glutamine methyltransferase [Poseidonibacter ostreae]|jgi:release factor glutamine methyltransferase|uniref:peptide chain release factor N(5)-glutamine methyltransferase n=1 Tax=Poseidonibacter ostreae TaxID=2654171 RepID=A0A6L4WVF0_9BACT|nr:peptide chain release factor N(5)-glutamine methyltransferase [Poseidonibacter ostreae]KAB7886803.1 peptide chain release factor N(5)-glutamine methyltransferase [Poseidonibacter ostreae]KAB7890446.1 peptide chain release factor N(5)-glutamine methyltransferase [Poseidonibacter ostreae]KAB7892269.1 peptide chain release factor N(5)-glutamine methyltransferase [Poseidonibacter ostreae]MAC84944.1 protein-(glutamine-N5) methyltransferase, release factor-specific [Arcobacter sp.]
MTIKDTIRKYTNDLKFVTHIPAKEVEMLMMYLLEKNTIWLHLNYNKEFEQEKELGKLIKKRATNYPMEYIINKASFYGEVFIVQEGVLIPRPETELLIDSALEIIKTMDNNKRINVLEIGTGSGIISVMLALLIEDIKIIAVDINEKALELAKKNAVKHGVEDKIEFRLSNLYENINETNIDLTISNPPYIANDYKLPDNVKFEPSNALFGGRVGDELLKDIIDQTNERNIEYLLCEMGYDQKNPLTNYLQNFDIKSFSFYQDYEKFDRGFTIQFKK